MLFDPVTDDATLPYVCIVAPIPNVVLATDAVAA